MRVLLLADIHANWPALATIVAKERFDLCLCLGDIVEYGPQPRECVEWARDHCRHVVRGNHDHCLAQRVPANGDSGYKYLTSVTRAASIPLVGESDRRWLAGLPLRQYLRLDGKTLLMVHATPRDPLDEYLFDDAREAWEERVQGVRADYVLVGHTHRPFVLPLQGATVINPGSAGQPRDGDPRACYAIMEDGVPELRRAEYPLEETIEAMNQLDVPRQAQELTASVLRAGGLNIERVAMDSQTPTASVASPANSP